VASPALGRLKWPYNYENDEDFRQAGLCPCRITLSPSPPGKNKFKPETVALPCCGRRVHKDWPLVSGIHYHEQTTREWASLSWFVELRAQEQVQLDDGPWLRMWYEADLGVSPALPQDDSWMDRVGRFNQTSWLPKSAHLVRRPL